MDFGSIMNGTITTGTVITTMAVIITMVTTAMVIIMTVTTGTVTMEAAMVEVVMAEADMVVVVGTAEADIARITNLLSATYEIFLQLPQIKQIKYLSLYI